MHKIEKNNKIGFYKFLGILKYFVFRELDINSFYLRKVSC